MLRKMILGFSCPFLFFLFLEESMKDLTSVEKGDFRFLLSSFFLF